MIEQLLRLLADTFPSVDHSQVPSILAALRERGYNSSWLWGEDPDSDPWQGDVVDPVTIYSTDDSGAPTKWTGPAILLSNTCDFQEDGTVLAAACLPAVDVCVEPALVEPVTHNQIAHLMYLEEVPNLGNRVVDLSMVQTLSASYLRNALGDQRCFRRGRFAQLGYFVFLAKLTVHLMRPETKEVSRADLPS
jgi:hypothetical protein